MDQLKKIVQRFRYPGAIMLTCTRWYLSYSLSYRDLEEIGSTRSEGRPHEHLPLGHQWVTKITPLLAPAFRKRKRSQAKEPFSPVG